MTHINKVKNRLWYKEVWEHGDSFFLSSKFLNYSFISEVFVKNVKDPISYFITWNNFQIHLKEITDKPSCHFLFLFWGGASSVTGSP